MSPPGLASPTVGAATEVAVGTGVLVGRTPVGAGPAGVLVGSGASVGAGAAAVAVGAAVLVGSSAEPQAAATAKRAITARGSSNRRVNMRGSVMAGFPPSIGRVVSGLVRRWLPLVGWFMGDRQDLPRPGCEGVVFILLS